MNAPRHRPNPDARGFTLAEVMVALLLFAVGALALAALMPAGMHSNTESGQVTRASEIAALNMERLLDTPYTEPDLDPGTHADPDNPYAGSYFATWVVEDNQPFANCKRITAIVRWPTASSNRMVRVVGINPRSSW